ncbi:TIGR03435 family protein [Acidipila sp. EB88]|uniref:TIGR03435 family protein n=1 Tax=Acidipila sp. EB88 TaxID=2305226 RepID=UPI000F5E99C0|nr:TIGR03435 family protein [Acidipila sp. EB88]RRA49589.1 TIGR03435 family protein [Acidipila sp. EB88]
MVGSAWSDAWSAQVVNHVWQSTLVVLVAWGLALRLRKNRAGTRYWIWMAASLKFLLPFSVLAALGRWVLPASAAAMPHPSWSNVIVKVEQPAELPTHGADTFGMWLSPPTSSAQVQHHGSSALEVLMALWLCGAVLLLLRWLRNWWEMHVTLRDAAPALFPIAVPVFLTSRRIGPAVVGLFQPKLLLPLEIHKRLPEDQLHAILAHEVCHVQRRDNLTGAVHMLVEVLFWFHPGVWWIERRLIAEREAACDEAVLQLGNEAEVYAEGILNVCKFYAESPLVCVSGVTGSELKQRIVRILTNRAGTRLSAGGKLLLSAALIAMLSVPVLSGVLRPSDVRAQAKSAGATDSIAATWQGTLHTDRDYRFVVKITSTSNGRLRSTFYNLSEPGGGSPGFSTTLNGSLLQLDFGFAMFEGSLGPDGNSITGKWHQGPNPQPLIFLRASPSTAWAIPVPPPQPAAMAADSNPEFEVFTIKPSRPEERGPRFMFNHRRFSVVAATLDQLVQFAYSVQEKEVAGAPDWFRTATYDIAAQPNGNGEPSIQQWRVMVRKLMADRFQLRFHNEKREMAVYALTVAKGGPKFTRSEADASQIPMLGFGPGNMGATNATMAQVAEAMQQGVVDRPVIDQTGLSGRFDLRLRWHPADAPAAAQDADALPDVFTAMQEQLGLRLSARRASVDVIVVDRVAKPSDN